MAFPVTPLAGDDPREFLIQDPFGVRESILPLLTVNRDTGLLTGLGTVFCADPFQGFLTAQHIFEEVDLTKPPPDFEEIPFAMLNIGMVFGTVGLTKDLYAPVLGMHGLVDLTPVDPFIKASKPTIVTDCLRLAIDLDKAKRRDRIRPVPIRCRARPPRPGDRLMAVGYPELGIVNKAPPGGALTYVERMYGAIGTVVAVHPQGICASRPWPTLEIAANWRSGMSGGPLFNEDGEVVGLVSSSVAPEGDGPGTGFGLWFGGFPINRILPTLDCDNPGRYRGFGVFRSAPWNFAGLFADLEEARAFAAEQAADYRIGFGSHEYGTDNFISVGPAA